MIYTRPRYLQFGSQVPYVMLVGYTTVVYTMSPLSALFVVVGTTPYETE